MPLPKRAVFRARIRSLATLIAAVAVAACADTPSAAVRPSPGGHGRARLGFEPVFSAAARAAAAQLADFGITFDHVRVVIVRPVADTLKDTTITFAPGQADVTLDFPVDVHADGESFHASIDYTNPGGVVFHGEGTVQSHAADQPAPTPQITVEYAGPGATVTHVALSPKLPSVVAPASVNFTATGFDANNAPVQGTPFAWTTSDPTLATISNSGILTTTGKRGTVTVTAVTPTNVADSTSVTISLTASGIVLVSGGGQTGKAGARLSQPGVVRVTARDGLGVGGVPVNFAAPSGGAVGSASVTTDASGIASTSLTLGGTVGSQSFAAVALGFSVDIPATATAGDLATVAAVSGGGQSDTVRHALKLPLVAKVTDQFGNGVSKITVNWLRTAGSGTLSGATSVTGADGQASIGYTLGGVVGTETITASAAGASAPATFTETALAGAPAAIAVVAGNGQTARILQPLAPFVVKVTDAAGNPVKGTTVAWAATNGTLHATTTTDSLGQSSNTMTLGTAAGTASATATAGEKSATFSATVQTGIVSKIVFKTGPPTSAPSGPAMAPAIQIALQDSGSNLTAATNAVTIALGANPHNGTLSGTLTRNAVAGIATFDDLKLDKAGEGYTLVGSSAGVANVTSGAFTIVAGAPANAVIVAGDGQTGTVNTPAAVRPSVRLTDSSGNVTAGAPVSFTPVQGSGSAVPTTPVSTDSLGVATATSWTFGVVAGPQSLVVSSPGVPSVTVHATVVPGAAAKLAFLVNPTNTVSGSAFAPTVQVRVQDANNNAVTTAGNSVTLAVTSGTGTVGAVLSGTSTVTAVNGVATFGGLGITTAGTAYTLTATSAGLTPAASSAFNITGPPPTLSSMTPSPIDAVFSTVPVTLAGTNFVADATAVSVNGGSVTAANVVVLNATSLTSNFNIAGGAPTTTENVTVTTASGTSSALPFTLYAVGSAPVQLGVSNGDSGGSSYDLDCPAGAVATGLNVRGGANVDQLQVVCQTVSGAARTLGAPTVTGAVGGAGGSPSVLSCPTNYILTGLSGRIGSGGSGLNDMIAGLCSPITGGSTVTTASVGSNFTGSIAFTSSCPVGLALTGIQGGAGDLLDRTQIKCR